MRRAGFVWQMLWIALALLGASGCTKPRSVLALRVTSDVPWGDGAALQSLAVTVRRGGLDGPLRCAEGDAFGCPMVLRLGTGAGQHRLPLTFVVTPAEASDVTGVWVEVLGCGAAAGCSTREAVASWSSTLAYTSEQTQPVEVFLTRGRDAGTGMDADASEVMVDVPTERDVATDAADREDARDDDATPDVVDVPGDGGGVDVPPDVVVCASPRMECGGRCVDTTTDVSNCGGCGRACSSGQFCMSGGCALACSGGRTACGMNCVDLQTDAANCGSCGRACRMDQACAGSACGCPVGQTECSGRCVDLTREPQHCGRCGNVCASGRCTSGVCDCPTGQTRCGTACVDTQTDAANCGACGRACRARGACVAGVCIEQRSCRTAGTPGCGVVDVVGNVPFTLGGDSMAYNATPGQMNIRVGNFSLDAYEVTVARFRVFWAARTADGGASIRVPAGIRYPDGTTIAWGTNTGRDPLPRDQYYNWSPMPGSPSREAHPINGVDWWTAQEFCVWDGGTGTYGMPSNGRLPTEAEWEYAARYRAVSSLSAGRVFPWGDTPPSAMCDRAQWNGCMGDDGGSTRRVGSFPTGASGGLFDLAGNVWEWTADWYSSYSPTPTDAGLSCWGGASRQNPICNNSATGNRVVRGGSWFSGGVVAVLRSASRLGDSPVDRSNVVGFRCAGTLTE